MLHVTRLTWLAAILSVAVFFYVAMSVIGGAVVSVPFAGEFRPPTSISIIAKWLPKNAKRESRWDRGKRIRQKQCQRYGESCRQNSSPLSKPPATPSEGDPKEHSVEK